MKVKVLWVRCLHKTHLHAHKNSHNEKQQWCRTFSVEFMHAVSIHYNCAPTQRIDDPCIAPPPLFRVYMLNANMQQFIRFKITLLGYYASMIHPRFMENIFASQTSEKKTLAVEFSVKV